MEGFISSALLFSFLTPSFLTCAPRGVFRSPLLPFGDDATSNQCNVRASVSTSVVLKSVCRCVDRSILRLACAMTDNGGEEGEIPGPAKCHRYVRWEMHMHSDS